MKFADIMCSDTDRLSWFSKLAYRLPKRFLKYSGFETEETKVLGADCLKVTLPFSEKEMFESPLICEKLSDAVLELLAESEIKLGVFPK